MECCGDTPRRRVLQIGPVTRQATVVAIAAFALLSAAPASGADRTDPTGELIPTSNCDEPTCQQALEAYASADFEQAGQLFSTHFEESDSADAIWLIRAAYAHRRAGATGEALQLFDRAASQAPMLEGHLSVEALRTALDAEENELTRRLAERIHALDAPLDAYPDGELLAARVEALDDELPDADTARRAVSADSSQTGCTWLVDRLADADPDRHAAVFDAAHGFCITGEPSERLQNVDYAPSSDARLQRAHSLAGDVRFEEALEELDRKQRDELDAIDRCRADFLRGRSHYLRRRRTTAENYYRRVVDRCTDDANEDERVRSLYALGRRMYRRDRLDESQRLFETLYREYPHRSHADDALMFLARIERSRDEPDRNREIALLYEALENYPHEDMIHEMAWEVFEETFRGGDYREFIDQVTRLPLPGRDEEYFSQGRLEYFVGLAHHRLEEPEDAALYWQWTWVTYPFSFYGYLAQLRMVEQGIEPAPLQFRADYDPPWFPDRFDDTGTALLAKADQLEAACEYESVRQSTESPTRADRWRLATICHHAGDHDASVNIARRGLSGRPWSLPPQGRLHRWHVAFPDPHREQLVDAIARIGPTGERRVDPGLATAIMREESNFIEDVVSWAGAVGLMQLMPATAGDHADVVDGDASIDRLKTAEVNIPIAVDHLRLLAEMFDGHPVKITAAYNAGAGRIRGWVRRMPNDDIGLWTEDIPIRQTRNYTKRVIGTYAAYQYLRGLDELDRRVALPAR